MLARWLSLFLLLHFCPLSGEVVGFCQEIHHQQLWHPLTVKICYQAEDGSLDASLIKQCAARFLKNYPNEKDYWEVMNVKMAGCILQKYPSIRILEIEIAVLPDELVPFHRKSLLRYNDGSFEEIFSFLYEHPFLIEVCYTYKASIQPEEYPDFLLIYRSIDQDLLQELPWETLRPLLIQQLLDQFPMIAQLEITRLPLLFQF
ncbi:MAG: hypothetical protein LLG04_14750 [Parachlamydia sp.]|nr:hypothetical protein [Parachlamydia sp.]